GLWQRLHQLLLSELRGADKIDWERATVDASFARAWGGGEKTGPDPTGRGKPGGKRHVVTEGRGLPRAARVTGANPNEVTPVLPLVDAVPPGGGQAGASAPPARGAVRGPGLRPPGQAARAAGAPHQAAHPRPAGAAGQRPGGGALGGGADGVVAAWLPAAAD